MFQANSTGLLAIDIIYSYNSYSTVEISARIDFDILFRTNIKLLTGLNGDKAFFFCRFKL